MSDENDPAFYHRREAQEKALAETSLEDGVAAIHTQMAERYAEKARIAEQKSGPSPLR